MTKDGRMRVRVVLHLEEVGDGGAAWWAESPELPTFTATDASLQRLADLCEEAVAEAFGADVSITWSFARSEETTVGVPGLEGAHEPNDRPERVQFVQQLIDA